MRCVVALGRPLSLTVLAAFGICFGAFSDAAPEKDAKKESPAPAQRGGMLPIAFKLPMPYFGSTPLQYYNPHLEAVSLGDRKPFFAPAGAANIAFNKTVSSSAPKPAYGTFGMIVDGEKGHQQEHLTELPGGTQWIQIDLGQSSEIYAVLAWHYHATDRVYFDVIVRTADDAEFTLNVHTLYNNDYDNTSGFGAGTDKEYVEDFRGRLINALDDGKATSARFVRLYSTGNTTDDTNHYVEVEVWGKPAAANDN